jgi:hypothetical protein
MDDIKGYASKFHYELQEAKKAIAMAELATK